MNPFNEEEILEQLRSGSLELQKRAFERVVSYYSEKLYYQIRKLVISHDDANDLLQNTFLKAWMNIGFFRGDARLSTWMYKIAFNESMTFLNKQHNQNSVSIDEKTLIDKLECDEYFDGDALQIKLQKAILSLPDKQRAVFNFRYNDEMPYEQMAEITGTSVGALKASYHHAVKKIEEFINRD
jgi:RNA polymerase sigma-70 factor (ECF subfamily)